MSSKTFKAEMIQRLHAAYQDRVEAFGSDYTIHAFYHDLAKSNPQLPFSLSTLYNYLKHCKRRSSKAGAVVDLSNGSGAIIAVTSVPKRIKRTRTALPMPAFHPLSNVNNSVKPAPVDAQSLQVRCCGMDFRIGSTGAAQIFMGMLRELKTIEQEV